MIKYKPMEAAQSPRFSGIRTFMRIPYMKEMNGDMDFAIVGVPFDTGASYRSGARLGPAAIRENSLLMRNYSMNLDVNIFDNLSGVDYGDVSVLPGDIHQTYKLMEDELTKVLDADVFPIVLGGDHSITLGELRAVAKKHGPVALVHFDSHLDTWDNYWGLKYTHGTPFRRAVEEGLIDTEHSIQIGIRGSQYGPEDVQGSIDLGFQVVIANEIHETSVEEVGKMIRDRVKEKKVFLTFDIDFVDPAYAPGTGTTEVGGFTGYQTIKFIREMKDLNFVGFDLVEVLPALDPSQTTAYMAANIVHEFLAVLALQKQTNKR